MTKSQKSRIIALIFIFALLPRLILAIYSTQIPSNDDLGYDERAMHILDGKGFGQQGRLISYKEPFYSFFLAGIYSVFGHNYAAARIMQAFLGALVCVIIFLISARLFNPKIAFISGLISAFNPGFVKSAEYLLTENLYTFLLVLAVYFLVRQAQEGGIKNLVILGLILGVTALTRAVIFFFPLFIALFMGKHLIPGNYSNKKCAAAIILFIFCFILPISPWTIRNWKVHHRFVPIVSRTGAGLYTSYLPPKGKLFGFDADDENTRQARLIESEVERDAFLKRKALDYIIKNPRAVLKLELLKIAYFWSVFDWEIVGYGVYNFMYGFILPFFIYAIAATRAGFRKLLPVYLPIIYSFLIALATYGSPRFRLPVEPYIIILGSAGIVSFVSLFRKKIVGVLLSIGYLSLNIFFFIYSYQIKIFVKSIFEKLCLW